MEEKKVLIVPGGGIYFFWMLGFLRHVLAHFNTDNVVMLTASGGALAALLACCQVDTDRAVESAYRIGKKHGVINRRLNVVGVCGAVLEEWLEEVLPEDAADRVRDKVRVIVHTAFPHQTIIVSKFRNRESVIKWVRAACHVPFLTDYKPFYWHQGLWCYDAGIGKRKQEFCRLASYDPASSYYVDYMDDPTHHNNFPFQFAEMDFMRGLIGRGAYYARYLETHGWFDGLERKSSRQPNTATNTDNANRNTPNSSWYS